MKCAITVGGQSISALLPIKIAGLAAASQGKYPKIFLTSFGSSGTVLFSVIDSPAEQENGSLNNEGRALIAGESTFSLWVSSGSWKSGRHGTRY